uniref:Pickpocket protein 28 n=1 Tax=Glossina pallidipes TaxID=7398 RepID=A0A1B0AAZ8_GLOPL
MKCQDYINTTVGESSIHGCPYLVKQALHWLEKIFWGVTIIAAAYWSINICYSQWERFRDNPIILATELTWGKLNYPFVGITLCFNYTDEVAIARVIKDTWAVEPEDRDSYQYYFKFLKTINDLTVAKLSTLEPYRNDDKLKNLDFVQILLQLKGKGLPKRDTKTVEKKTDENAPGGNAEYGEPDFRAAITELGMCQTTSQTARYTNPYEGPGNIQLPAKSECNPISECNTKIFNRVGSNASMNVYMHNNFDIVTPGDRDTIFSRGTDNGALTVELMLGITTAEAEVRKLPIAYRKCRYTNENNLNYFRSYSPGLCRTECRVHAALAKCGCKPYFYAVGSKKNICDVKGMLCLEKAEWPESARCNCLPLCEEVRYVVSQKQAVTDDSTRFESTVIIKVLLPRMGFKRRVVFSADQLIVSFGGAIGLFLGASFISVYAAAYWSINICYKWERFRDKPIILATWGKLDYSFVGITLCFNYTDEVAIARVIKDTWAVEPEDRDSYQYYFEFLKTINDLTVGKLSTLEPYRNDDKLKNLDFVQILLQLKGKGLPKRDTKTVERKTDENAPGGNAEYGEPDFRAAITELGMCQTTSQTARYTNPYEGAHNIQLPAKSECNPISECNAKIFNRVGSNASMNVYMHNNFDIVTPGDRDTILSGGTDNGALTVELTLGITTAEAEVRKLPIAYRKCRYTNENKLRYSPSYSPGLCRTECRIHAALAKCGCKPYFYAIGPKKNICDVKGMLCLEKAEWPESARCNCLPLCEEIRYVVSQAQAVTKSTEKFESTIIVKVLLPRVGLKRRVVFSADQLIVSFGGAIGLFLGASFISVYGLVFTFSQFVFSNISSLFKKCFNSSN